MCEQLGRENGALALSAGVLSEAGEVENGVAGMAVRVSCCGAEPICLAGKSFLGSRRELSQALGSS